MKRPKPPTTGLLNIEHKAPALVGLSKHVDRWVKCLLCRVSVPQVSAVERTIGSRILRPLCGDCYNATAADLEPSTQAVVASQVTAIGMIEYSVEGSGQLVRELLRLATERATSEGLLLGKGAKLQLIVETRQQ